MTQTPPLDLEAVQERHRAVFAAASPIETGETYPEHDERIHREQDYALYESACDVPALIAEIRRLRQLWNSVLVPPRGPDAGWRALVRQQTAELTAKDRLIGHLEEASARQQAEIDHLRHPSARRLA
jgi:hypothetical protein